MNTSRRVLLVGLLAAMPLFANLVLPSITISHTPAPPRVGDTVSVSATGGTGPYTMRLFVNGIEVDTTTSDRSGVGKLVVYSGASGDLYEITVTDANNGVATVGGSIL